MSRPSAHPPCLCGEKFSSHRLTGEQKGSPMTLLVKDANTSVQSLATVTDGNGNLVPAHATASTNAQGIAAPVGPQNPLPVVNTAGNAASDGSGMLAAGGSAQTLFGGAVPANGYLCRTIPRPRCGSPTPAPPRMAAPRSSSHRTAASSRRPPATSRPARSVCSARRPANPSPPAVGNKITPHRRERGGFAEGRGASKRLKRHRVLCASSALSAVKRSSHRLTVSL